ncbi:cytochrome b/b6 domain-containing protein [Paracoccus litorisediminis]|jgi:cytochrome b561|uniref:Cytochrome b n=1 Tax=Paracoccus litorisediminis TaxID=2006130 RepID=A0A844HKY7_9RHOB|nr:cytochrome b/b6 domain-containing protein [Paracoccus litorisediminis]MTH60526.1 cytochrome b [Paracoccus litorisediminis]
MPDRPQGYRVPARMFHWGIALAVLLMIPAGLTMTREGLSRPLQDTLFIFHKNLGVLLFPFILARLAYRLTHPPPPLPDSMPDWQKRIARLSHVLLYTLLILMPLSGFTRVRAGGFPIELLDWLGFGPWIGKSETLAKMAQGLHYAGAMCLIALLTLHVAATLHHALIRKDSVWPGMWPPRG